MLGGSGADILIYRAWENVTNPTPITFANYDIYDGGNGSASGGTAEKDTLWVYLSQAQMADATFKNVQVLKGIPVDEFLGTMGLFAAALSADCWRVIRAPGRKIPSGKTIRQESEPRGA